MVLIPTLVFADTSLELSARIMRDGYLDGYKIIYARAEKMWAPDYELVIQEVNEQCKSCFNVVDNINVIFLFILKQAIFEHSYGVTKYSNIELFEKAFDGVTNYGADDPLFQIQVDWKRVEYTYLKNLKAIMGDGKE